MCKGKYKEKLTFDKQSPPEHSVIIQSCPSFSHFFLLNYYSLHEIDEKNSQPVPLFNDAYSKFR